MVPAIKDEDDLLLVVAGGHPRAGNGRHAWVGGWQRGGFD